MKTFLIKSLLLLSLATGVTGVLWGAGFWEKKDFPQWSVKDIRRIMTNSPWAREIRINSSELRGAQRGAMRMAGGGGSGPQPQGGSAGDAPDSGGNDFGGGGGDVGDAGGDGGGPGAFSGAGASLPGPTPSVPLTIRWQTSLPVKQAIVKHRFGDEAATSGEGKKFLARDEPHYIVVVSGMPAPMLALFRDSEAITAKTFLKRKKKENIVAARVEAKPVGQLLDVSFWFPRTAAVTLEDKDVEFETKIGRLKIKRKFKLKDMVFNGELSL